jgi:hypothetical protein
MGLCGGIEEHHVEAGARRGSASTEEFAFALRGTEDYRQAQLGGGVGHRLADREFGEVEVADSSAVCVGMSEDFAVCARIGRPRGNVRIRRGSTPTGTARARSRLMSV